MGFRPVTYFINLLARDTWFSPQPYHQLASVFLGAGDSERAEAILYAAKERERHKETDFWGRTGLWLLKVTVGYGIGSGPWLILVWVLVVTLVGMVVLARSPGGRGKSWSWRFGASLDHLLPIVELSPEFTKFFDDPGRERLAGWQMGYFAVHAILGYVLAAVLAAAVAGLTHFQ
ncbi:MAG: hypothetical protein EAZ99_13625 [Alphaproteobacteria bacterium]|nr:MAG: hypothetical protein EAZ99_13625 [Alphaproteobacteria bacterium]